MADKHHVLSDFTGVAGGPPSLLATVRRERDKYPDAEITADQSGAICNAVAWEHRADDWGCSGKRGGSFAVRHDGMQIANDILHHRPSNHVVDCLGSAGDRSLGTLGVSTPIWIDHGPNTQADRPWVAPIQPQGQVQPPASTCALGATWFPAIGLRRHDRARYNRHLAWLRDTLAADYVRIFYYLGGPPWAVIGNGHRPDQERHDLTVTVIEDLLAARIKPQFCVFATWVPEDGRRNEIICKFRETVRPYAQSLFGVDCYNEPGAIGVPEYGYVRQCGRELAGEGYPLLSLASPNSVHQGVQGREATDAEVRADTSKLYGGMSPLINCITPHWGRSPWRPHRDLGPEAAGRKIINDEPRGFRSSVDEISDPVDFRRDYAASKAAGDVGYTFHPLPGIWAGYCAVRDDQNVVADFEDIPRINEIVAALHSVRGASPSVPSVPPSGPRSAERVSFRSHNGKYLCAELDLTVVANRDGVGPWEEWRIEVLDRDADDTEVALKSHHGMYLCAEGGGGGVVHANRAAVGPWERWRVHRVFGQIVALQAHDGHYLCVELDGSLNANRDAIGPWEQFTVAPAEWL